MDTEQRYLRDIRDALKGVEKRSAMQVNGNEKAKYLKDIAEAIRENGGGGGGGGTSTDEKVKQTPVNNGTFDILLSESTAGSGVKTEEAQKSETYPFKYTTHNNTLMVGDYATNMGGVMIGGAGVPSIDIAITNATTNKCDTVKVGYNDIILRSYTRGGGPVQNPQTWDGTNTSLKAALAAANFTIKTYTVVLANYNPNHDEGDITLEKNVLNRKEVNNISLAGYDIVNVDCRILYSPNAQPLTWDIPEDMFTVEYIETTADHGQETGTNWKGIGYRYLGDAAQKQFNYLKAELTVLYKKTT